MRSRKYGIQPIPPSDSAILSVGNFVKMSEKTSSVAQLKSVIGVPAIMISIGAPGSCRFIRVPDPMWMQTTVPSSAHAFQNGSQFSLCRLGKPRSPGLSAKVMAWQPFFATRRTSRPISSGSQIGGIARGMKRPGCFPHQLVDVPVVVRAQHGDRELAVAGRRLLAEQLADEARHGREAERAEHAVRVHVLDARVDVVAAGAELGERGRLHAVLLGRAARRRR